MKSFSINPYKIKRGDTGSMENSWFKHYYRHHPNNPVGNIPEPITYKIKPYIPDYVTTIVNFGCANGRDFIPFQENYDLIGLDLVPGDFMEWVCDTTNLTYYQCSMEDYLNTPIIEDLSTHLIYTNVSLFYLKDKQESFISYLLSKGCKNMVFQEYKNNENSGARHGYFQPGKHQNLFEERHFKRKDITGFIYLDNTKI